MSENNSKTLMPVMESPLYYVGIGASAGGLEAIEAFFEKMPPDSGLAFIIIQHLSPHFKSLMTELLSKRTQMPVYKIEDGMKVEANSIYMIPPRKNLSIFHGRLLLKEQDHSNGINLPIDIFFQSLAEDQGEKVIGIILSGTGSDGTRGVRKIKELGGMLMVQSQESAKFDGMPRSAINTGLSDFVLAPENMPEQLLAFIQHPYAQKGNLNDSELIKDNVGLPRIFALLREKHKIDFTYYKPTTILRRLERRMTVNQIHELKDYVTFLESYPQEITTLYRELLIGVTSFFRDKEAFQLIEDNFLPEIFKQITNREIRLWIAGCSTGEEAYTFAMLCREIMEKQGRHHDVKIFATDVDRNALTQASNGVYPESIAADLSPKLLAKYFNRRDDNYHVNRSLREMVVFAQHNIIKDPPFTNIDLVSCRNLLIYLQPVLQKKALEFFNFALNQKGVLFLGSSESLGDLDESFDILHPKWKIYRSKGKRKLAGFATESSSISYESIIQRSPASRSSSEADNFLERFVQFFAERPEQLMLIVVNENGELVYSLCDKERFLTTPVGKASYDVSKMIIKELSIPLATGLQKVFKTEQNVRYSSIYLKEGGRSQTVQMHISLLPEKKRQNSYAVVLVEKSLPPINNANEDSPNSEHYDINKEVEQRLQDLEQELQFTKENLQATIEELETSNEELQATNEELLASNEELQSTNEELQSVNEELFTVNAEHQQKIMELTILNNDVENLLRSTEIATIFIDENMEVRKFTPNITQLFKIIDSDLGRPLSHVAHFFEDIDPLMIALQASAKKEVLELEISTQDNQQFLMKVLPYQIADNVFSGVVMTFTDITAIKTVQKELQLNEERYRLAQHAAAFGVWDWNITTDELYWSEMIEPLFGLKKGEFKGSLEGFLTHVHPEDREQVKNAITTTLESHQNYHIEHRVLFPDKKTIRWMSESGRAFYDENSNPIRMLGVIQDITEQKNFALNSTKNKES